ncbi:leucyl/phenylalanyl-tRNA--protein transferase [Desulfocicer vacuolatum DSM 3385]|uniref:Leucyl/phenylalanyl-tRNA--protein transferase n=1 Tax=Desulfocicer vacuolatum DSM 3385 TaxID=1121400 RepID=A0A1W2CR01_9BACT|nr:leucyl/phenylalanyl-tRNA--protein transferase [Desulfocicer vacuolatum]SMC87312.1 leucyl/phenylalanyl-tRNA--protein transferase [Desulfocicer vacuolatum DSM 3385]
MPVFRLSKALIFPPAHLAREDGLLGVGGDLSSRRLILAYENGIFPWFSQGEPLLWWSPDPRMVLYPRNINISRSLNKCIRQKKFTITMDQSFKAVITACAHSRTENGQDTWLVDGMIAAYTRLHEKGVAHSVEAWQDDKLVGGLYGVSLGRTFFGESMFSLKSNSSKVALAALCRHLTALKFDLIDCQVATDHLASMGAVEIPRSLFLQKLTRSLNKKPVKGSWTFNGFM